VPARTTLHWFRRDLRVRDNTALARAATDGERVVPVFVLDDAVLARDDTGAARVAFLVGCLRELADTLAAAGSRLVVVRGDPARQLPRLAQACGAAAVHWNKDYEPFARGRDARVAEALAASGIAAHQWKDHVLFEEREILNGSGRPFTVFTPYARVWASRKPPMPLRRLRLAPFPSESRLDSLPIPSAHELGFATAATLPPAGESAALRRLRDFVARDLATYAHARNVPACAATSGLSPYLRVGAVSVRAAYAAAARAGGSGARTWVGELAWRDFYYQILFHHPNVEHEAFQPEYRGLPFENDRARFEAWCAGATGYPIVDAAMRQLRTVAWMHNRARMIVASFLAKDLLVDWRWGERWFMQHLVDGDLAANNGGWQWSASTGTDAQPYFRIFNPTTQGEKIDPDGDYVRRWVPELSAVPARWIHRPWDLPPAEAERAGVRLGSTYPARIVVHEEQRPKALAMYEAARQARR
jgi:deoxyribodipyrimidine photo-lyase